MNLMKFETNVSVALSFSAISMVFSKSFLSVVLSIYCNGYYYDSFLSWLVKTYL